MINKPANIANIFNKFAGKEVSVTETEHQTKYGKITSVTLNEPNQVVKEMEETAKEMGFDLRLWLPGSMGTCDWRTDRVNAYVEKEADGKYRVSNNFNIG